MSAPLPPNRFAAGRLLATPGVLAVTSDEQRRACLLRHLSGDWGSLDAEDRQANDDAVTDGTRIFSAYPIDPARPCKGYGANAFWIITEADRSVTTFLLPCEY